MIYKLFGVALLSVSGMFYASYKSEKLRGIYEECKEFCGLLELVEGGMTSYGISIRKILRENGINKNLPEILEEIRGEELSKICVELRGLGSGGIREELRIVSQAKKRANDLLLRLDKKYGETLKIYRVLGAGGGAILGIILM